MIGGVGDWVVGTRVGRALGVAVGATVVVVVSVVVVVLHTGLLTSTSNRLIGANAAEYENGTLTPLTLNVVARPKSLFSVCPDTGN